VRALTDSISYNVGDEVLVDLVFADESAVRPPDDVRVVLRYAGESSPTLKDVRLSSPAKPTGRNYSTGYCRLWRIPFDARTGRYEIDLLLQRPGSGAFAQEILRAGAFVVTRKLVRINRIELSRSVYTSGDPLGCSVTLTNLSSHPLSGLRVEFSERYWPWIASTHDQRTIDISVIKQELQLQPSQTQHLVCTPTVKAREVNEPVTQQYAVMVWDPERKALLDIAFSAPVVLRPPGGESPKAYPRHYIFERLRDVNTRSYREFTSPSRDSAVIKFDRSHTMFGAGSVAVVRFSVASAVGERWQDISILARLLDPTGKEIARDPVGTTGALGSSPTKAETQFGLPPEASGIHRVVVELRNGLLQEIASAELELAVNPLPSSVLIFCAHEDDEGAHAGIIRAAVENRIPLNIVYLTSGDAGSCDRYYQQSCGPAEAFHFGTLRMEEARAALGHLGVPQDRVHFLGLPDGGLGQIWHRHRESSNPYRAVLLATEHAPYEGLLRPNLPFARDAVTEAVKEIIRKMQPEVIYTGHPDERHADHRATNWFVVKALQELRREGAVSPTLTVLVDQVYGPGPQRRAPYRYRKHVLHISGDAAALAQEAQWFYQSQSGNRALGRMRPFIELPRAEVHSQIADWSEHEGWNENAEPPGD